ncbi:ABC transporter ATP-binding protein [Labedella populi]|uniref:ABC transporter ATP-binding protein n=1 Tax=Labedella populi TaxID=2498850 RepID=A0A3S4A2Z5_9MICO|nr:ABC transporter ATP-binding protein [Labedella populi]RWZ68605.1 ABC transporter ATP-binding protein [Labedella populi]
MSLEVNDLRITIDGRVVVDGISFRVEDGERVGLIGESGSGKSLTALAVLGLLPDGAVATGSIHVDGDEVVGTSDRDVARLRGRRVGIVFQEPRSSFNPIRSLGRQLADPVRRFEGVSRAEAAARAVELARLVRLPDPEVLVKRYPHQVSGGQLQRAAIGLALAGRPQLLIADEPTTALDVTIQAEILDLFDRLVSELGTGLLFITHDLAVLRRIADRAVVLQNGSIVEDGSVDDLVHRPRTELVRRLVESARATSWSAPGSLPRDGVHGGEEEPR